MIIVLVIIGMVELFFVDTNPFVEQYFTDPEDHTYDWSNVLPRDRYISNLLHVIHFVSEKLIVRNLLLGYNIV